MNSKHKNQSKPKLTSNSKEGVQIKNDSMMNAVTKIGVEGYARNPSTEFQKVKKSTPREYIERYCSNALVKMICDSIGDDMCRKWFEIIGDDEAQNLKKYIDKKLHTQKYISEGISYGKCTGKAIAIMIIDDGKELDEPVNINNIQSIDGFRVVDLSQLYIEPTDYYVDPNKTNYQTPQYYTVVNITMASNDMGVLSKTKTNKYRVHESRLLEFDGVRTPRSRLPFNRGFQDSILQALHWDILNLEQSYTIAGEILNDFITTVLSIKGLDMKLSTVAGEKQVMGRMQNIAYSKSLIKTIFLDAGGIGENKEEFNKITTSLAGLVELLVQFEKKLAAMLGRAHAEMFGETAKGVLNDTDNQVEKYYSHIQMLQEHDLEPQLLKLLKYVSLAQDCKWKGNFDELQIKFNSLHNPNEAEQEDIRAKAITSCAQMLDRGAKVEIQSEFGEFDFKVLDIEEEPVDYEAELNNIKDKDDKMKDDMEIKKE